ncbi:MULTISPECIES: acyl carrier protein [unclassified Pseudomonas]|uniref:acyl carrier protein n=1 Tax=unclassified Pseudomonas TaxID=196821 RepID=UPI00258047EF|nr:MULTISPECIES: acyl carrier protein [unclassified Pseudomonas]
MSDTKQRFLKVAKDALALEPDTALEGKDFYLDLQLTQQDWEELMRAVEEEFGIEVSDEEAEKANTVEKWVMLLEPE